MRFETHSKLTNPKKMKNLVLVLLLVLSAVVSHAQANRRIVMKQATAATSDTVTNTGTAWVATVFTGSAEAIGVQATMVKISGTVGGTLQLQGSIDGTNWFNVGSSQTPTDVVTNRYLFLLAGQSAPYTNYRVLATGTGTMSAILSAILVGKN